MTAGLNSEHQIPERGEPVNVTASADKQNQKLPLSSTINLALFWAFIAGLAWTPFFYGSNNLIAWGINAILFAGLAMVYEVLILLRGERHAVGIKQLWAPAALFFAVLLWIVIQDATWTPSSWHHPIWVMTSDALQRPIEGSISVNRDLTALALVRLITAASVFWIALQLCRDATRAYQFVIAIVTIISGYVIYGLISFAMTSLDASLHRFVTSTFVNHNHFSTYAGIGFITSCGLILRHYRTEVLRGDGSLRFKVASFIEATGQRATIFFAGSGVTLAGVLLSGSRGGVIATVASLIAFGILSLGLGKRDFSRRRDSILFGAFLVVAAFLAFGEIFVNQMSERNLADENRLTVYMLTLRSIFDAPVFGYGYGTFIDVFPMIRDRSISVLGAWDQAHNTYLEVFQGLGLVFGSMLVGSVIVLVLKCLKGAIRRQEQDMVPSIAASAAILTGVHAMADFSLQIQAVALTFVALLGAGVAQSESSLRDLRD